MDNRQYNPYEMPQNGAAGQEVPPAQNAQPVQNTPPTQNPYAAQQNPPPQNPYTQYPYGQPGYGQVPPYAQQPPYNPPPYAPQPPYGQNPYVPPYAQGNYGGYAVQTDPHFLQKKAESRTLRTMSMSHGLAVVGFTVLAYVISFFLVMIPGFSAAYTDNSLFSESLDIVYGLVIIFIPFFLNYLFQKKRGLLKELPLGTPNDGKAAVLLIFIGVMCCVAGSYATGILTSVFEGIFGVTFTMPESTAVYNSVPMFLLAVLGTAIVPAFVEEFAIRGTVMQPLRKYGDKFAMVMSALVFALMHGNMVQIPFAFIAGLAIGYAVTVTDSMWVGIAIHFLNNFSSVLMQTAVDNLSDKQENFVILAMLAVIFTAGVICLLLYLKNYVRPPLAKGNTLLQNGEKTKAYICTVPMILAAILLLIETAQYIEF